MVEYCVFRHSHFLWKPNIPAIFCSNQRSKTFIKITVIWQYWMNSIKYYFTSRLFTVSTDACRVKRKSPSSDGSAVLSLSNSPRWPSRYDPRAGTSEILDTDPGNILEPEMPFTLRKRHRARASYLFFAVFVPSPPF